MPDVTLIRLPGKVLAIEVERDKKRAIVRARLVTYVEGETLQLEGGDAAELRAAFSLPPKKP